MSSVPPEGQEGRERRDEIPRNQESVQPDRAAEEQRDATRDQIKDSLQGGSSDDTTEKPGAQDAPAEQEEGEQKLADFLAQDAHPTHDYLGERREALSGTPLQPGKSTFLERGKKVTKAVASSTPGITVAALWDAIRQGSHPDLKKVTREIGRTLWGIPAGVVTGTTWIGNRIAEGSVFSKIFPGAALFPAACIGIKRGVQKFFNGRKARQEFDDALRGYTNLAPGTVEFSKQNELWNDIIVQHLRAPDAALSQEDQHLLDALGKAGNISLDFRTLKGDALLCCARLLSLRTSIRMGDEDLKKKFSADELRQLKVLVDQRGGSMRDRIAKVGDAYAGLLRERRGIRNNTQVNLPVAATGAGMSANLLWNGYAWSYVALPVLAATCFWQGRKLLRYLRQKQVVTGYKINDDGILEKKKDEDASDKVLLADYATAGTGAMITRGKNLIGMKGNEAPKVTATGEIVGPVTDADLEEAKEAVEAAERKLLRAEKSSEAESIFKQKLYDLEEHLKRVKEALKKQKKHKDTGWKAVLKFMNEQRPAAGMAIGGATGAIMSVFGTSPLRSTAVGGALFGLLMGYLIRKKSKDTK